MTLIEVVGALALLSGVLVAILIAKNGYNGQWARAQKRQAALAAADALLKYWWQEVERFPAEGEGELPGQPDLSWHTFRSGNGGMGDLGVQIVSFEVRERGVPNGEPLLKVDLVLNDAKPKKFQ